MLFNTKEAIPKREQVTFRRDDHTRNKIFYFPIMEPCIEQNNHLQMTMMMSPLY